MQKQVFTNKLYESALGKIKSDYEFYLRETVEKLDLKAIVDISNLTFIESLMDEELFSEMKSYFKHMVSLAKIQHIQHGDYDDWTNQGTIIITDLCEAADFLVGCKLFVKVSTDYTLIVDNGKYIFRINADRISEDINYVD